MNELQVKVLEVKPAIVKFNYDEMSAVAKQIKSDYENLVFTEETVKDGKKTVAELRKIQKSINDFKVKTKKEATDPVSLFESQCKDLISEFDEPINFISQQLDTFETNRIAEKTALINQMIQKRYEEIGLDEKFKTIEFGADWLNSTKKTKDIEQELEYMLDKCVSDQNAYYTNVELIMTNVKLANAEFSLGVDLDSEIFIKQLDFKTIDQIKEDIKSYAQKQKSNEEAYAKRIQEQEEAKANAKANAKAAETVSKAIESVKDFIPEETKADEPLLTTNFRIKGTRAQFDAIKQYILACGVEIL